MQSAEQIVLCAPYFHTWHSVNVFINQGFKSKTAAHKDHMQDEHVITRGEPVHLLCLKDQSKKRERGISGGRYNSFPCQHIDGSIFCFGLSFWATALHGVPNVWSLIQWPTFHDCFIKGLDWQVWIAHVKFMKLSRNNHECYQEAKDVEGWRCLYFISSYLHFFSWKPWKAQKLEEQSKDCRVAQPLVLRAEWLQAESAGIIDTTWPWSWLLAYISVTQIVRIKVFSLVTGLLNYPTRISGYLPRLGCLIFS